QEHMDHADALLRWLKSYEPEKLFDAQGRILEEIREIAPTGDQRMAKNPITNGGIDPKPLIMPDWKKYTLQFEQPGSVKAEDMTELGKFVREIIEKNPENFRIFGPDETKSNRLNQVFKTTNRQWMEKIEPENDEWLSSSGRVIDSQLSEHQDEGFLEGYVLTGRYGFFASYESFLRVVDSMLTQHFKWMRKSHDLSWRNDYPSLNLIASSTVFQQDHNGYSHQDPGILTHLAEKKAEFIREYLPADANTLLAVMDKAFRSSEKINLIISSKHPRAQFYSAEEAAVLVNEGLKIIDWASTAKEEEPELVIAAAGTESNLEALVAVTLLLEEFPKLKIRFINVVDLLKLRHPSQDPRGLSDEEFDQYFTKDKPILFAFHGYETLVRTIFFDRHNHHLMIHGYKENGDITTPFDMRVVNELDRYHLAKDAALKIKGSQAEDFAKKMDQKLQEHQNYIRENGIDLPEVLDWKWKNLDQ
ncbi:MAG: phosphoketolase family protein, partial [Enterococcus faecium]|nr:phosphoketolase family protein [Enterococcus faecium]